MQYETTVASGGRRNVTAPSGADARTAGRATGAGRRCGSACVHDGQPYRPATARHTTGSGPATIAASAAVSPVATGSIAASDCAWHARGVKSSALATLVLSMLSACGASGGSQGEAARPTHDVVDISLTPSSAVADVATSASTPPTSGSSQDAIALSTSDILVLQAIGGEQSPAVSHAVRTPPDPKPLPDGVTVGARRSLEERLRTPPPSWPASRLALNASRTAFRPTPRCVGA